MDAIVGVWITSVVGAAAFSAAGYVIGNTQKKALPAPVVLPPPAAAAVPAPPSVPSLPRVPSVPPISKKPTPPAMKAVSTPPMEAPPETKRASVPAKPTQTSRPPLARPSVIAGLKTKTPTAFPPPPALLQQVDEEWDMEDRPTLVPDMATQAAALQSSAVTIPPPQRAPSLGVPSFSDQNATRAMIQDALAQVEHAAEQTKALEIIKHELERQLEVARTETRNEVILRAAAEARSEELSDRLARASEEASSLRHRVNMLDRQTKLLRESLKGGRPAPVESRRRDLEEAEEMRAKLRDVVDKLERASLPPPAGNGPPSSRRSTPPESALRPFPGAPSMPRSMNPASDDAAVLREEVARLAAENRTLRAQTLGSLPPKPTPPRDSQPEIDLELYQGVMDRLNSVAGLKCAVLADETGTLILGQGELAENLAAFGAYIRDASARTDRLLPLEGVEEVDIRDKTGMHLSTRVVLQHASLSIVLLASADASIAAAKKVVADSLRL